MGASINGVRVSCVAGAIGCDLYGQGEYPSGQNIRALVPVNLRPLDDA